MANPEHLKILKQGVEVWNRWREENPRIWIDLQDSVLVGNNFRQDSLRGAKLSGVNLKGAVLKGADLKNTELVHAILFEADLSGADLSGANLAGAVLKGADLKNTELVHAILFEADLSEADLSGAKLNVASLPRSTCRCTDFRGAVLHGADFTFAHLNNADFTRAALVRARLNQADLRDAKLWDANLNNANLGHADLRGADLRGAILDSTVLGYVDLSEVKGLQDAVHKSLSFVGTDTLYLSRGRIPETFLRGCGVPENLIQFLPSLVTPDAFDFYSSFVSYSHVDKSFARRLHDQLQARGIRCWLDEHDLKPGDRILDVVSDAIRLHDRILLCCSEASLKSWWVKDEIRKAQERERREDRDIIIPLMVDRYLLDGWEDGMAADFRSRLAADFTGWEQDNAKFDNQFERVVKALRTDEGEREKAPQSKL